MFWVLMSWFLWSSVPARSTDHAAQDSGPRLVLRLLINDVSARVVIPNQGTVRVQLSGPKIYGLVPALGPAGVRLGFVELTTDRTTGIESARQVAEVTLVQGIATTFADGELTLSVQWTETLEPQPLVDGETCPDERCCVKCGDVTVCACLVETSCGRCCCANKCTCDFEGGKAGASAKTTKGCGVR